MHDADGDGAQVLDFALEQFIARVGFQDIDQRLVVMAVGHQPSGVANARHLAPQEGDFRRPSVIGDRGEQADEAGFADHFAGGVETLHDDHVKVGGTVHGGAPIGLHHAQQARRQEVSAHRVRQTAKGAHIVENRHVLVAQQTEARHLADLDAGLFAAADEVVVAGRET